MSRSAYIVGLGGTGQWILTYLKKELLEINLGKMPNNVKLLGIDTQPSEVTVDAANAALVGGNARLNALTDAHVADVRLDRYTEFVQIGGPLLDFIQSINEDKKKPLERQAYKHLSWVEDERLLRLGMDGCNTTFGAGAVSQLGRLSLFKSVDTVFHAIITDLQGLQGFVPADSSDGSEDKDSKNRLEIFVASSIAGGTGSGILIDTAWLIQLALKRLGIANYALRGFIVLPTAFDPAGTDTDKQLKAFATWSQLDRFLLSQLATLGFTKIIFNPNANPPTEVVCNQPAFSATYLIDPNRAGHPLSPPPEDGTFPAIAQVISLILDEQAGLPFSTHEPNVTTLGKTLLPPGVYHSAVGSYTIKVPVYRARAKFSRELAFAALEKLCEPHLSDVGIGIGLRADRNRETTISTDGEASRFLQGGGQLGGQGQVTGTALFPHIEAVYQVAKAGTAAHTAYVNLEAGKVIDRAGDTFIGFVDRVPDPTLQPDITKLRRTNFWDVVKPSKDQGKTPAQNYPNVVAGRESVEVQWFGQRELSKEPNQQGQYDRTTNGERTKILKMISDRQVTTYRAMLKAWSWRMLNGGHQDPIIARGGKLGYAQSVCGELIKRLTAYDGYLKKLKQRIISENYLHKREQNHDSALKSYTALKSKTCILCFFDQNVHPRAREAEREYLRRTQKLFDYYLSDELIPILAETIQAMLSFTREAKAELDSWEQRLVTGKTTADQHSNYSGLYNHMRERIIDNRNALAGELRQGNPRFGENGDRNLRGVMQLIMKELAQNAYQDNPRWNENDPRMVPYEDCDEIRTILREFCWEVDQGAAGLLKVSCGFQTGAEIDWMEAAESPEKVEVNYSKWLQRSQSPFVGMANNQRIDLLLGQVFTVPTTLANNVIPWCEPMYQRHPQPAGAFNKAVFVRMDDTNNKAYMQQFRNQLRSIASKTGGWELNPMVAPGQTNSTDPFKLSLVHVESLLPSRDFALWERMNELFIKRLTAENAADPSLYFIYAAEKRALSLALEKPRLLNKNFEMFDPEVVSLLEDEERVRMFFLAYAQHILTRTKTAANDVYEWSCNDVHLSHAPAKLANITPPSIFDIIRIWILGRDVDPRVAHSINFDGMVRQIMEAENREATKAVKTYQKAIPEMQEIIDADARIQEKRLQAAELRYFGKGRYADLKDLAEIIYLERIHHLQA